jgi:hypothetical protein
LIELSLKAMRLCKNAKLEAHLAYIPVDRLMKKGKTDEAIAVLDRIRRALPDATGWWRNEGVAEGYMKQKRYKDARDWIFRQMEAADGALFRPRRSADLERTLRSYLEVGLLLTKVGETSLGSEVQQRVFRETAKRMSQGFGAELRLAAETLNRSDLLAKAKTLSEKSGKSGRDILDVIALRKLAGASELDMRSAFEDAFRFMSNSMEQANRGYTATELAELASQISDDQAATFIGAMRGIVDSQNSIEARDDMLSVFPEILAKRKTLLAARRAADQLSDAGKRAQAYKKILDVYLDAQRVAEFGFAIDESDLPKVLPIESIRLNKH